jgi:hypothetical protein
MIETAVEIDRLIAFKALADAGASRMRIQQILNIKKTTYYAYRRELIRLKREVRRLEAAESA